MKWITILFAFFILLIIVLADLGKLDSVAFIHRIPYGDKAGHFILYGILTLLLEVTLIRSLPHRSPGLVILSVGLLLALLIGLEEFSQQYFSKRTFDLVDLWFSYLGVILFSLIALKKKTPVKIKSSQG